MIGDSLGEVLSGVTWWLRVMESLVVGGSECREFSGEDGFSEDASLEVI